MKVKELITLLQQENTEAMVVKHNDGGTPHADITDRRYIARSRKQARA